MDGISLLKTIRNNPNVSHIPFILLTSKAEYKDRIDGLSKGADVYLGKPFIVEELKVHIKNLIETRLLLKGKFSGARDQEGKIEIAENKSGAEARASLNRASSQHVQTRNRVIYPCPG